MPIRRLAAIYDIHGNLPALEAVLEEVRQQQVDHVVVGGDVVPGPMPCETIARLLDIDVPVSWIRGNGDREVRALMAGTETTWYRTAPEQWREPVRWTARELTAEHEALLAAWPATCRLEVAGIGRVLFCHATPQSDTDCFTSATPAERLAPFFGGLDAALVVCGHTHMPFDRRVMETRVVNAGSVGMPFGEPGADWLLLGTDVQLRHTRYDLSSAAARIRATAYPQAEEFAERHVLHPPSAAEMLEVFSRASL